MFTDRINAADNVVASIRPSVSPFVSTLPSEAIDRWHWNFACE